MVIISSAFLYILHITQFTRKKLSKKAENTLDESRFYYNYENTGIS